MVIYSIIALISSNSITSRRDKSIMYSKASIIILVYSILLGLESIDLTKGSQGLILYGGLYNITSITQTYIIFLYIISSIIIGLTAFYPRKVWKAEGTTLGKIMTWNLKYNDNMITNKMGAWNQIIEYPLILLFIVSGGVLIISSTDIVSIFISVELQSYGLYLLCTLYRNSEGSTTAGLTYFLLGGLSSTIILMGTSLLYVNNGTTGLEGNYMIGNISEYIEGETYTGKVYNTSLIIMLVGFLFKISAAPFHNWSPDVYDAIPTMVTTFVAIVAKISILILIFILVGNTMTLQVTNSYNWKIGLLISSLLSLIIGSLLGLVQYRIKRLLAYSTISHVGFILLAMSMTNIDSVEAFMFYLISYIISNVNIFLIIIGIGYSLYTYDYTGEGKEVIKSLKDRGDSPIQLISQLQGSYRNYPILSISLVITLFSFVGIPPLIGFFAKQMVLSAAISNGYIFIMIVGILTSVISAVYYLSIIRQMYMEDTCHVRSKTYEDQTNKALLVSRISGAYKVLTYKSEDISVTSYISLTISILTLVIMLYMIEPSNLLNIIQLNGLMRVNS